MRDPGLVLVHTSIFGVRMTKRILLSVFGVAAALALVAAPANAQIKWSVGAGISHPTTSGADNGFHGMAAAAFSLPAAPIGIRVDGMYHSWTNSSMIGVDGDATYGFAPGPISPYVLGGLSWGQSKVDGISGSSSDFGWNVGGGINFGLSALKLFAEARYMKIGDGDALIPITVGIHF
jgi:opacity protein-like surface antigen